MKIAVIGALGQLGADIVRVFSADRSAKLLTYDIDTLPIEDFSLVNEQLSREKPDAVINTAAFHNVEKCEDEPQTAFLINAIAVRNLARICEELRMIFVHVSTDYVFDGKKNTPYLEEDSPGPLSVYANSKLAGEYFALAECSQCYVLRVSGLYGLNPCRAKGGLNFIDLMLKLARERGKVRVVNDEFLTPTSTLEIARQLFLILDKKPPFGILHCTSEGSCSWYQFAAEIFRLTATPVSLEEAAPGEFATRVKRPKYSVLENSKLKKANLNIMRPWSDALREYLQLKYDLSV